MEHLVCVVMLCCAREPSHTRLPYAIKPLQSAASEHHRLCAPNPIHMRARAPQVAITTGSHTTRSRSCLAHDTQHSDRLMRVGRPLEPLPPPAAPQPALLDSCHHRVEGRSLALRGRNWACSEVLRSRLETYADAINRQFPFKPDMPSLLITGQSLAALLITSLNHDITLQDIMSHLLGSNPAAAQELQQLLPSLQSYVSQPSLQQFLQHASHINPAGVMQLQALLPRSSTLTVQQALDRLDESNPAAAQLLRTLQVQVSLGSPTDSSASQADAAGTQGDACDGGDVLQQGIHVTCSTQRLVLHCASGQQASASFQLHNKGSVVLTYEWRRSSPPPHLLSQQQDTSQLHSSLQVLHAHGVLLPGDTHAAELVFKPNAAGMQREHWTLQTVPSLPVDHTAVALDVVGCALKPPSGAPARQQLDKQLAEAEKMSKVWAAVDRILADVQPRLPCPSTPETHATWSTSAAWDAANADAWPPLYWPGTTVYAQFDQLYNTARAALVDACQPPPPPPDAKKGAGGAAKKANAKGANAAAAVEAAAPAISWPETWSHKVADISALLEELSTTVPAGELQSQPAGEQPASVSACSATATAATAFKSQLAVLMASQPVRVPTDVRTLMRHAARAAICRVLDAVETKLDAVHADYAQRISDASNKPAAAGAPPLSASAWLADKTRTGAKAHLKTLVPNWWEEVAKEKAAIVEWLKDTLAQLDQQHNEHTPLPPPEPSGYAPSEVASVGLIHADNTAQAELMDGIQAEEQPFVHDDMLPSLHSQLTGNTVTETVADTHGKDAAAPKSGQADDVEYYWKKFVLLREWERLGLPGTNQHVVESRISPANSNSSTKSCTQ